MADFSYSENSNRPISSVRLVYGADPRGNDQAWLERVDRCARLVLQLKEDQLLSGQDPLLSQELYEMESVGFAPFEWDDDVEEEE